MAVRLRVRGSAREGDAHVTGASTRALRLSMATPPARGEIVEVMVGRQSLVGWVRWRIGRRCGIGLAEPINVIALLAGDVVPLVLPPATEMAFQPRRTLMAALASDGPIQGRLLQAVVILAILTCGTAWVLHVAGMTG
ncbi:hypothetical protein WBP06_04690 [Novosphingobium sp. BL-8H]